MVAGPEAYHAGLHADLVVACRRFLDVRTGWSNSNISPASCFGIIVAFVTLFLVARGAALYGIHIGESWC